MAEVENFIEPSTEPSTTPTNTASFNRYATKKTVAQGLMDFGLLMANASQMKSLISYRADGQDFYYPNLVMISLSIALQIIVGVILVVLGRMEVKTVDEKRHVHTLNDVVLGLIFVITVLNVLIGAFGIKISDE